MKKISVVIVSVVMLLISYSCGVDGDPGHCYFSVILEYYDEDYGIYLYKDDNPAVPDGADFESNVYYDCYPGSYDFYYESEDSVKIYKNEGSYTLLQNLGSNARLFNDGMDGIDTYWDLYLYVYARKSLQADAQNTLAKGIESSGETSISSKPEKVEEFSWEETKDGWTMHVTQVVSTYRKVK